MIKAIIFDVDGVLINAERFSLQLARDYGITTSQTLPFFKGKFQDCLIGKADLKEELSKHLKIWGWKDSVENFLEYWFKSEHKIDEGLIEYIKKLKEKGFKVYIATNNEKYRTEYLMNKMGFGEVFNKVYGSGHVGFKKPDHDFFEYILDDQKLNKNEVLFWDDDTENVKAANSFGIIGKLYTNFKDFTKEMNILI